MAIVSGAQGTVLDTKAIECDEKPCESRADELANGLGKLVLTSLMLSVKLEQAQWMGKARSAMRLVLANKWLKPVPVMSIFGFHIVENHPPNSGVVARALNGDGGAGAGGVGGF